MVSLLSSVVASFNLFFNYNFAYILRSLVFNVFYRATESSFNIFAEFEFKLADVALQSLVARAKPSCPKKQTGLRCTSIACAGAEQSLPTSYAVAVASRLVDVFSLCFTPFSVSLIRSGFFSAYALRKDAGGEQYAKVLLMAGFTIREAGSVGGGVAALAIFTLNCNV
uniref:Uncharacterized protein n=1 Tax=Glossina austeni TaxID=7395 RepID=A0A1A9UGM6_GLOAU